MLRVNGQGANIRGLFSLNSNSTSVRLATISYLDSSRTCLLSRNIAIVVYSSNRSITGRPSKSLSTCILVGQLERVANIDCFVGFRDIKSNINVFLSLNSNLTLGTLITISQSNISSTCTLSGNNTIRDSANCSIAGRPSKSLSACILVGHRIGVPELKLKVRFFQL